MKKNLGIFLFYDKDGIADRYISFLLNDIRKSLEHLIIIINGEANEQAKKMFSLVADEVHSCDITFTKSEQYRYAILDLLGHEKLAIYDTLVLMDNSFFGPFFSFEELFKKADLEKPNADFWGLSSDLVMVNTEDEYEFDLQTYFLVIRSEMLHSDTFYSYWNELRKAVNAEQNERFFNRTFTRYFRKEGWIPDFLYDTTSYDTINNTVYNASFLMNNGFPIARRDIFLTDYRNIVSRTSYSDANMVIKYINDKTTYDVEMIYENIIRCSDPYNLSCILNLNFILPENYTIGEKIVNNERYAVLVVHLHYDALFDENLEWISNIPECVDLIITTTSEEKEISLKEKVQSIPSIRERTRILLSNGAGRDMAGILVEAREYIEGYRYVGFTHDKMSLHHDRTSGHAFARIILENIVGSTEYMQNIFSIFERCPHIGILVPPPPEHGNYFATIGRRWTGNFLFYRELCNKLGISVNTNANSTCMALGTAFWCRSEALASLLTYPWTHDDFPSEPLPLDGSISHAIERSFPFIAKYHGYMTGFIYNQRAAAECLNNREYMLVDYLTNINDVVNMAGNSLRTYISKSKNSFNVIGLKQKMEYFKKIEKSKKKEIKIISKSRLFDEKWYVEKYPEVRLFQGLPAEHYLNYGWLEGKDPSKFFHTEEYLRLNNDVRRVKKNPLLHYEVYGRKEGRRYAVDYGDYRANHIIRAIKRKMGIIFNSAKIKKNSNARILVILHLFYMCSWKEIKEYLMNLDVYNYDLIITYTTDTYNEEVFEEIRNFKPDLIIQECDNVGYDIGPYLVALEKINLNDYDIIFKLQSKGVKRKVIYIYGQYLKKRDWFLNLYEGCIGAFTVHKTIDKLMNSAKKIGIVAAKNLIVEDPSHKQHMVIDYMREIGMQIPNEYMFVAGSCFAVRAKLMKPIQEKHYQLTDFSSIGNEFSLAHKLERIICLTAFNEEYQFSGNQVMSFKRLYRKLSLDYWRRKHYNGIRIINDKRFKLDDEFVYFCIEGWMIKRYELVELPLSEIKRKWLNEIITISECYPYKYLITQDPKVYEEYCELNKKFYKLDIMSRERFDDLMKAIDKEGFKGENVIVVNEDNILMDGQHRCCYMMYKFGQDYKVPVLRVYKYHHIRLRRRIRNALQKILPKRIFEAIHRTFCKLKRGLLHRWL